MTPIVIQLTILEAIFLVIINTTTIAGVALWIDRRRIVGIAEAERHADARIKAVEMEMHRKDARIDFMMDMMRDKTTSGGQTCAPEIDVFRQLSARFSIEELEALTLEAGLQWDNISGDTADAKAANMVKAAARRGTLQSLIALIKRERP